jgi:hypothetical protein
MLKLKSVEKGEGVTPPAHNHALLLQKAYNMFIVQVFNGRWVAKREMGG